jgi:type II secretory pathway pseudopilin PulG
MPQAVTAAAKAATGEVLGTPTAAASSSPATAKPPSTVSQKLASAGSRGSGKLVIGALAVLVLIAGVVGIARHNSRKRAALNQQQEFQQAMQQAQQAIDLAKQAEQLTPPAQPATSADAPETPPTDTTQQPRATDAAATPTPPAADNSAATNAARKGKAKATTGDLQIVSEPAGAHVDVDGQTRPEWVTPFVAEKLTAGKHNITVSMANFATEKRTADVVAGKKGSLDVKLTTTVGTVKVASTPAGADILLNGKPTGQKTPATLSLPPGNHVLKLHHDGFQDATENVTVVLGQAQSISGKLTATPAPETSEAANKAPASQPSKEGNPFAKIGRFFRGGSSEQGTLVIKTTPPGAKVKLNGDSASSVTPVTIQTKIGKYKVQLELDGYQSVEREITVEKGKQTGISETLVHK